MSIEEYNKIVKKIKYRMIVSTEEMMKICEKYRLTAIAEYKFHPTRKWRADWLVYSINSNKRYLIELEGWGRHQRYLGFENDCIKYAEAFLLGYNVVRLTRKAVQAGYLDKILKTIAEGK